MNRYNRQEITLGVEKQKKLSSSSITIVGMGALGTLCAQLLCRAGVGKIKIIDFDEVSLDNLQRQQIYTEEDIGLLKTEVSKKYLDKVNKQVSISIVNEKISSENLDVLKNDLILDCVDNLETSYLISDYCKIQKLPLVFGSAIRLQGYVYNQINSKTIGELFNNVKTFEKCKDVGVMNTITSTISSIQSNEAIKILVGNNYEKKLMRFDLQNNELLKIKV
jgi:molybdopterin/thiamine biosynthesis adenylyltransferase